MLLRHRNRWRNLKSLKYIVTMLMKTAHTLSSTSVRKCDVVRRKELHASGSRDGGLRRRPWAVRVPASDRVAEWRHTPILTHLCRRRTSSRRRTAVPLTTRDVWWRVWPPSGRASSWRHCHIGTVTNSRVRNACSLPHVSASVIKSARPWRSDAVPSRPLTSCDVARPGSAPSRPHAFTRSRPQALKLLPP